MTGGRVNINARLVPSAGLYPWHQALTECAGDDCRCRRGDPVHPPLLMMFDPDAGEYREASRRCSALWAVATEGRDRGRHCAELATHQMADVLLCEHHYRRMRDWMNTRDQRDQLAAIRTAQIAHEEQTRLARERTKQQRGLDKETARQRIALAKEEARERARAEEAARAEASLVYYVMRDSDSLIKIGTSRTLAKRLVTLKRESGPLRLITTEGGTHKEETALHRRFADLRAEGEWFRPELPLLEHVHVLMRERPLEPAPGLPPLVNSREIGGMIARIRGVRAAERRLLRKQEEVRLKRQRAREARRARATAALAETAVDPAA